jgi:hypothetical protein
MATDPIRHVARIDRHELFDLPAHGSSRECGRYLRRLLHSKGIDSRRLFQTEYHPFRRCWLLIQEAEPGPVPLPPSSEADATFYRQTLAEFRRAGLTAWAKVAAASSHFARCGRLYELPVGVQELAPADLADLLRGPGDGEAPVRFDGEGGWRAEPSNN